MLNRKHLISIFQILLIALLPVLSGSINTSAAQAAGGNAGLKCDPYTKFNSEDFSNPTRIDNPWYPLVPGTQFTLDGTTSEGTHRVVFTVTDLTKVINGVRTRVLWDRDYQNGELAESELAFQAQDNSGNVWVLGEYPEEYENGKFSGAPDTWISGFDGAKAGILVPGHPEVGSPAFVEGLSRKIDFYDCGQVTGRGLKTCVPSGCYDGMLEVNEWSPLDPEGGFQEKYYAPGVGNVQIGALNDPEAETLTLTSLNQLSSEDLREVRRSALKLDHHGYDVSNIYSRTSPAELMPGDGE